MESFISISWLNDFVFCPYSIYLHNVYGYHSEDLYHEPPQQKGKNAHQSIDNQQYSTRKSDITGLPVYSEKYKLVGKIDLYKAATKQLIERKNKISILYDGYKFQLYAQYFCMTEMGFEVGQLGFYSFTENKLYPLPLPVQREIDHFEMHLRRVRCFDPITFDQQNSNKCRRCIYRHLCDKTGSIC